MRNRTRASLPGAPWRQAFLRCNAYGASWLRRPIGAVTSVALRRDLPPVNASPSDALATLNQPNDRRRHKRARSPFDGSSRAFNATGDSVTRAGSRGAKERLERMMQAAKAWTFHDMRRTVSTNMGDIGV
jgi:hypothetical protein